LLPLCSAALRSYNTAGATLEEKSDGTEILWFFCSQNWAPEVTQFSSCSTKVYSQNGAQGAHKLSGSGASYEVAAPKNHCKTTARPAKTIANQAKTIAKPQQNQPKP